MKFFGFGEEKKQYTKEKFDEANLDALKELKKAMAPDEPVVEEYKRVHGHGPLLNRWEKLQAANDKLAELYNQGRDEAHKYNELMDEANKATGEVVDFEKREFGIDSKETVDLDKMDERVEKFLNELEISNPEKAEELTEKYEEVRSKADEAIHAMLDYEEEIGIERKDKSTVEV